MTIPFEALEAEALKLEAGDRARLAEHLIASLDEDRVGRNNRRALRRMSREREAHAAQCALLIAPYVSLQ